MLTAISIDMPYCPVAAPSFYDWVGSAVSLESEVVKQETNAVTQTIERSQSLFGAKAAAISQLNLLAEECKGDDWDGNGSNATNEQAVLIAEQFVRVIPDDIPLPEFAPEPDGSISLDWIQSRDRVFSISIGADNRLAYAWIDGTDKGHAVAVFNGQRIPPRVMQGIRAIVA